MIVTTDRCSSILNEQHGILVCFDATNNKTLSAIEKLVEGKIDQTVSKPPFLLVELKNNIRMLLHSKSVENQEQI